MDIGARAKKILHAVVSEYRATGEAVGSQTVTRRYGLDVSAATVRNVMGDLEDVGLLRHAHTSGGRIPTERGLRYYVDTLLRVRSLSLGEKDDIRERLGGAEVTVPEVMQRTVAPPARAVAPDGRRAGAAPRERRRPAPRVRAPARGATPRRARDSSGQVQNKLVPIDFPLDPAELEHINNYLHDS